MNGDYRLLIGIGAFAAMANYIITLRLEVPDAIKNPRGEAPSAWGDTGLETPADVIHARSIHCVDEEGDEPNGLEAQHMETRPLVPPGPAAAAYT